jgi:hypothetical protein
VSCEVKLDKDVDCGFTEGVLAEEDLGVLRMEQGSLILQSLRHVILGQFSSLPYRHVLHITITGSLLRIWKFSPTGCRVTAAIDYIKDPQPIVQFLMALKRSPVSGIGSDLGSSVGDGCMFRLPSASSANYKKIQELMERVARIYRKQSGDDDWRGAKSPWDYWEFDPTANNGNPATNNFTPFTDLVYVFPHPIHYVCSMTSRATRCYLVVKRSWLISKSKTAKITPADAFKNVHVLKTAWKHPDHVPEIKLHSKFVERRDKKGNNGLTRVATVLAGGTMQNTKHTNGITSPAILFPKDIEEDDENGLLYPDPTKLDAPDDNSDTIDTRPSLEHDEPKIDPNTVNCMLDAFDDNGVNQTDEWCELRWILFTEVGGKLSKSLDVGELVQVFIDVTLGECRSFLFMLVATHHTD